MGTIAHGKEAIENIKKSIEIIKGKSIKGEDPKYIEQLSEVTESLTKSMNTLICLNKVDWEKIVRYNTNLINFEEDLKDLSLKFSRLEEDDITKKLEAETSYFNLAKQYILGLQEAIKSIKSVACKYFTSNLDEDSY